MSTYEQLKKLAKESKLSRAELVDEVKDWLYDSKRDYKDQLLRYKKAKM